MRSNRNWAAEMDVRWARQERAEYHGRTEEEARELRISLGDANAVVAVQGKAAVKITRGETVTDN